MRLLALLVVSLVGGATLESQRAPNVLFIVVDDLNDWAGPFGGNPQAKTPHIDRLAAMGSVVFQNAHCPGPVCGASRAAVLSGFRPDRTGVYGNRQNMRRASLVQSYATLPEYFSKHGYVTRARGKVFHAHRGVRGIDCGQWAWDEHVVADGGTPVDPARRYSRRNGIFGGETREDARFTKPRGSEFGWGPTLGDREATTDFRTARWAAEVLGKPSERRFFLAVGIFRPHLPWHVPQDCFDRYPLEDVRPPRVRHDDLDDVLDRHGRPPFGPTLDYRWATQSDELFRRTTRAYLAATSFADDCVGTILDGLARGPHADDTIVVLLGDHGWHLGEKLRYRKGTLWLESTRAPLIVRTPGMTRRRDCNAAVNLLDLHRTLIEACGLPPRPDLDGRSLVPLLRDPTSAWPHASVTTGGPGEHSVVVDGWHYIRRRDSADELYRITTDPTEHDNLIRSEAPAVREAIRRARRALPEVSVRSLPEEARTDGPRTLDPTLTKTRDRAALK